MANFCDTHLDRLVDEARACRVCADVLPLGPRPVLQVDARTRLLIVGQAPGTRVHRTGIPWNDPSGDRLRDWMAVDRSRFYTDPRIGILPTGLCYPGRDPRGGDLPPRPECAPLWHPPIRSRLTDLRLTLLLGGHAQAYYLGRKRRRSLAETVAAWEDYLPDFVPLPHPSPRNRRWFALHPWFEAEVIPALRRQLATVLGALHDIAGNGAAIPPRDGK